MSIQQISDGQLHLIHATNPQDHQTTNEFAAASSGSAASGHASSGFASGGFVSIGSALSGSAASVLLLILLLPFVSAVAAPQGS